MCRSVRQTPQVFTLSLIWPGPGSGSGSSAGRSGWPGWSRTIARIGLVGLEDLVERRALGGRAAGLAGGGDEVLDLEFHPVLGAGHARDVLLHQRPAEVVDAPAERLGRALEPHLDPARLQVGDRLAERQAEGG